MDTLRRSTRGSVLLLVLGVIAIGSIAVVTHSAERQRGIRQLQEAEALAKLHWALEMVLAQAGITIEQGELQPWPPRWVLPDNIAGEVEVQAHRERIDCPANYRGDCYAVAVYLTGAMNTAVRGERRFWGSESCGAFVFDQMQELADAH